MGRAQRRARQRAFVAYMLDGPPKERVCGQAKAAARRRARAAREEQHGDERQAPQDDPAGSSE